MGLGSGAARFNLRGGVAAGLLVVIGSELPRLPLSLGNFPHLPLLGGRDIVAFVTTPPAAGENEARADASEKQRP